MIRVFLLDDHGLMRTGYRMILAGQEDMEVVGEAGCGEDAMPMIKPLAAPRGKKAIFRSGRSSCSPGQRDSMSDCSGPRALPGLFAIALV